jgi:ABC-type multidrug transport system ATPase subunit
MRCELIGVSKRFGRDWIFKDVDMTLEEGQHTALLGSNGSGKSTLLRIIAGQLGRSKGELQYSDQGKNVPIEKVYRSLSFVAPYIDVYRQLTFKELIDFHFSLRSLSSGKTKSDVLNSIQVPAQKALNSFSSGMIQRVKLALSFYTDSSLMIFDEPTMNLDEEGSEWFIHQLQNIPQEVTVIVASNVPDKETSTCSSFYEISGTSLMQSSSGKASNIQ